MNRYFDDMRSKLLSDLFEEGSWGDDSILELYRFQYEFNRTYQQFCVSLNRTPTRVHAVMDIPFLPVSAFKNHDVQTGAWSAESVFLSSGTTGQVRSRHLVRDLDLYHRCCKRSFEHTYGDPGQYTWLALLPSYLESGGSSLVEMVRYFMSLSSRDHGFFLHDFYELDQRIKHASENNESVALIGVSYALLDFARRYPQEMPEISLVMETGGMKGRRAEMTRKELHDELKAGFRVEKVHSEYGMTEMMHQVYAQADGIFSSLPGLMPLVREIHDPLTIKQDEGSGLLNIIDPGNIDSCAFISTDDLAVLHENGNMEIIGRSDHSEVRGCNLLYTANGQQVND